jgi:hypothetical protein
MSLPPLPKASKGGRPFFLEDSDSERLLTMVVALTAEVSVLHDKLDSVMRVAADKAGFTPAEVEAFRPDPQAAEERARRRAALIERVFRILYADAERAAAAPGLSYEDIVALVAGEEDA